jgi:hypothetical protein
MFQYFSKIKKITTKIKTESIKLNVRSWSTVILVFILVFIII